MAKRTSKKTQPVKSNPKPADAVQMLKADHKQVRKLFDRFRSAPDEEKGSIAGRLFTELEIHTKLEEELFYPAVRATLEPFGLEKPLEGNGLDLAADDLESADGEQIDGMELDLGDEEAYEEEEEADAEELITAAYDNHQIMKDLIQQLRSLDPKSQAYFELFTELEDTIIEHVAGEEDVILPMAALQLDVQALGTEMQRRKDDLTSQSHPHLAA
jgi:hemerythrin superfamily protein